jgi:hypothetical protein
MRVASSPKRPNACTPMGSPSSFQVIGTDMAGFPVTLATTPAYAMVGAAAFDGAIWLFRSGGNPPDRCRRRRHRRSEKGVVAGEEMRRPSA